jgi:hypothetical protein
VLVKSGQAPFTVEPSGVVSTKWATVAAIPDTSEPPRIESALASPARAVAGDASVRVPRVVCCWQGNNSSGPWRGVVAGRASLALLARGVVHADACTIVVVTRRRVAVAATPTGHGHLADNEQRIVLDRERRPKIVVGKTRLHIATGEQVGQLQSQFNEKAADLRKRIDEQHGQQTERQRHTSQEEREFCSRG